jgi:hypothetical protein
MYKKQYAYEIFIIDFIGKARKKFSASTQVKGRNDKNVPYILL